MNAIEADGWTIEEAIAVALRQLGVEREQVEIEILSQASRGFLGIGGKKARVRATLRAPLTMPTVAPQPTPARRREGEKGPEVDTEPSAESHASSRELAVKACEPLKEILHLMGVEATVAVEMRDEEVVLSITNAPEGLLIGRKGQVLDALEYVLNRIITKSEEGDAHLALDVEGYRERRRKSLEALALRLGERAKRRRRPVALSPLSPRDRRVIHLTLEGDPLVTTRSMGRGYFRRLYIVPEEGPRRERGRSGLRVQVSE